MNLATIYVKQSHPYISRRDISYLEKILHSLHYFTHQSVSYHDFSCIFVGDFTEPRKTIKPYKMTNSCHENIVVVMKTVLEILHFHIKKHTLFSHEE